MIVALSQRVETIPSYGERRDCLDQRWTELLHELGYTVLPIPNGNDHAVTSLMNIVSPEAVILTGGNIPLAVDPEASDAAPERDQTEALLLELAMSRDIPILGVCRGMQFINIVFGGSLIPVGNHVAIRHSIKVLEAGFMPENIDVNSYHNWGIAQDGIATSLIATATDLEGHVESFRHRSKRVTGIMWHPERETPFQPSDLSIIKRALS